MKFLIPFLFIFSVNAEVHVAYWLLIFHNGSNTIVIQQKLYDKKACTDRMDALNDAYNPLGYTAKCEQVS